MRHGFGQPTAFATLVAAGVVLALAWAWVSALASSGDLRQSQRPQFRAGVDLVQLDVSVLDDAGRPVKGLTATDFTVLEDGRPQAVEAFVEIDIPNPVAPTAPWMTAVAPDVRRNDDLDDRRLVVIVMDDASIQKDTWAIQTARRLGHSVVERLSPNDLAAVVFTRDNRNAQEFTTDRGRLDAAVDKFTLGFIGMGGAGDILYWTFAVDTMMRIAEILVDVPYRRKALIYIGNGIPCNPGVACDDAMQTRVEELYRRAQEANTNIYLLDVCGLRAASAIAKTCEPGLEIEFMKTTALNTGGRAVVDTNDLLPALTEVFESMRSYYLIGYRSPHATPDGSFHRIDVRVNRPGVTVQTRRGYWAPTEKAAAAEATAPPLRLALSGLLPKGDLPLQVVAAPFRSGVRNEATLAVVLGVRQELGVRVERTVEHVDVRLEAFTQQGRAVASENVRTDVALKPGEAGHIGYEVLSRINLRPGRYQLRVAARTESDGRTGSVYYDVDVPDFGRGNLALSAVMIEAAPGLVSAPRDLFANALPAVPTSLREFGPGVRATAFLQLYLNARGRPAPILVTSRVTDASGTTRHNQTRRVSAVDVGPAGADLQLPIPLDSLEPGAYLFTVEARFDTTSVRREVRFSVRR